MSDKVSVFEEEEQPQGLQCETPDNVQTHSLRRRSLQWASNLLGPWHAERDADRLSQQRGVLLSCSERQELTELVKKRMKNLGLCTRGFGETPDTISGEAPSHESNFTVKSCAERFRKFLCII